MLARAALRATTASRSVLAARPRLQHAQQRHISNYFARLDTPWNVVSLRTHREPCARLCQSGFVRSQGVVVVPQQFAWVVERFGKFHAVLEPGLNFLVPGMHRIRYVYSLKEEALSVPSQTAITRDNVNISIDGVLYVKVVDAYKAAYGVDDPHYAITQLAQTTMRSEIGRLTLDKTFEERDNLNAAIVATINSAASDWGIACMRYEIRDINPPASVRTAMEMQAEAERRKRCGVVLKPRVVRASRWA